MKKFIVRRRKLNKRLLEAEDFFSKELGKNIISVNYDDSQLMYFYRNGVDPKTHEHWDYFAGLWHFNEKEFTSSISSFDNELKSYPTYSIAYHYRGMAKVMLGNHEEAIEDFDQAIKFSRKMEDSYTIRAICKAKMGDFKGAIADCNTAIKINPDNCLSYYRLGAVLFLKKDYASSLNYVDKALESGCTLSFVYTKRASLNEILGDKDAARADMQKAKEARSIEAEVYYQEGLKLSKNHEHKAAIIEYDKALESEEHYHEYLIKNQNHGNIVTSGGLVIHELDHAREDILIDKAISLYCISNSAAAWTMAEHLIRKNPDNEAAYIIKALSMMKMASRLKSVIDYLKKVAQKGNKPAQAYFKMRGEQW